MITAPYDERFDHCRRFKSDDICRVCGKRWGSHYGRWCDTLQQSEFAPMPPNASVPERLHIGQFVITRTPGKLHIRCGEGEGGEMPEEEFLKMVERYYSEHF